MAKRKLVWRDPRRQKPDGFPRRNRGEGSITWRGSKGRRGLFEVRVSIGKGTDRKQVSRYFAEYDEAYDGLVRLRAEYGVKARHEQITFDAFTHVWLAEVKDATAAGTYRLYEGIVKRYLRPSFGLRETAKIDASSLDAFMIDLRNKKITANRRKTILQILVRLLNAAVKRGYLDKNPALAISKPKVVKKPEVILTAEQAKALLEKAKVSRHYAIIVLALNTGMRQGELFALHWDDVDLDGMAVLVRHSLTAGHDGKPERKDTKTGRSRKLDVSPSAIAVLREHRDRQMREGYKGLWVFPNSEGGPLHKVNFVRRGFYPILEAAKLPKVRFHSLRHVANSILASKGASIKVLQQRGGWSSSRMPLDVYGHLLDGASREAADLLDDLT